MKKIFWYLYIAFIALSFISYSKIDIPTIIDIFLTVSAIGALLVYIANKKILTASFWKAHFWVQLFWAAGYGTYLIAVDQGLANIGDAITLILISFIVVIFYLPLFYAMYMYAYKNITLMSDPSHPFAFKKKHESITQHTENPVQEYTKIGGWLYVVTFILIIATFRQLGAVYNSVTFFLGDTSILNEVRGLGAVIIYEGIFGLLMVFWLVYTFILMQKHSRKFPKTFVIALILGFIVALIDYVWVLNLVYPEGPIKESFDSLIQETTPQLVGSFLGIFIWGAYIKNSTRVKGTFVK